MDGVMWWSQSPWWRTKEIILPAAEGAAKKQNSLPCLRKNFFFLWKMIPYSFLVKLRVNIWETPKCKIISTKDNMEVHSMEATP